MSTPAGHDPAPIALPQGVTQTEINGLPALVIETDLCTGEVLLQGAQVTRWQPRDQQEPVLFVADAAMYAPGKSVRGGVPLCGPWFGPGRSMNRKPAHGFYRLATWRLDVVTLDDEGAVVITLGLGPDELVEVSAAAGWPDDASLSLTARLGATLEVSLTTATGADGADLEEALHSYLRVGDVQRLSIEGLAGADYVDKVDAGARKSEQGTVQLTAETDRVYLSEGTVVLDDPALGRRITVAKSGSRSTIVWNPWSEKALSIGDLGDDEWPQMVCVEAGNALENAVFIEPDSEHTISTRISVS